MIERAQRRFENSGLRVTVACCNLEDINHHYPDSSFDGVRRLVSSAGYSKQLGHD